MKQSYLWRLKKCDVQIKSWEATVIQLEALGAARECLPKSVARLKHARIVDDAEDERDDEVVLDACFFPHRAASLGASPLRRRTERDVRKDSCGNRNMVFAEGDAIHVLCATVSFKTARLRVVRTSSRVVCDSCVRSVSAARCFWLLDSGQLRVIQEQFIRIGCLMMAGTDVSEVQVSPVIEPPKGARVETTAVVQGAIVDTWEYDDEDYVFVSGDEVSADVQRRETHSCTDRGASRSACQLGYVSELTTRVTAPPRFSIDGCSSEQRGYLKVHWKNVIRLER